MGANSHVQRVLVRTQWGRLAGHVPWTDQMGAVPGRVARCRGSGERMASPSTRKHRDELQSQLQEPPNPENTALDVGLPQEVAHMCPKDADAHSIYKVFMVRFFIWYDEGVLLCRISLPLFMGIIRQLLRLKICQTTRNISFISFKIHMQIINTVIVIIIILFAITVIIIVLR